jgi:hypothetical protein
MMCRAKIKVLSKGDGKKKKKCSTKKKKKKRKRPQSSPYASAPNQIASKTGASASAFANSVASLNP